MGTPIAATELHAFATALLAAAGLAPHHARQVADVLLWADLRGVDSHGLSRLPLYLRWLSSGEMNATPQLTTGAQLPALAVLDADRAPGAVALLEAVARVQPMAHSAGVGVVLVRGTTHTGALGCYTSRLAEAGLVGWAFAASGPNMLYHGAAVPGVSTAPLSIAVPRAAGQPPIVFDMASAALALGRILQARRTGSELPPDSAADAEGRPTRDAARAVAPLPLGGAKGSGLALMLELVCSVCAGAGILAPALTAGAAAPHRQNALVLAMDYARIVPPGEAEAGVEALVAALKDLPAAAAAEILLPGERGHRAEARHREAGIVLPAALIEELRALANDRGVAVPWP